MVQLNQRKANSVKGMKAFARARVVHNSQISAAGEGSMKALTVMQSKEVNTLNLKDGDVDHGDAGPRAAGDFQFTAIAVPEMGQTRRGCRGENSGDGVGHESLNMDYGLAVGRVVEGQVLNDREECDRGLVTSIRPGMECSNNLVGFPSGCSDIRGETQEDDTGIDFAHYSLSDGSDGSAGLVAHGVD